MFFKINIDMKSFYIEPLMYQNQEKRVRNTTSSNWFWR